MSLGKRLINTGAAAAAACTTDSTDPFGDSSGVALYSLDFDASTAPDATTDYSGTPSNVTFGVGGQINYGARFNGSSSYIATTTLLPTNDFTFSCWVNPNSFASSANKVIYNQNITNNRFYISIFDSGKIEAWNGSSTFTTSSSVVNLNQWHNVVYTADSTNGKKIYVDGVEVLTTSNTGNNQGTASGTNWTGFGKWYTNILYLDGDLDQVRIFSKALDETTNGEVSALYAETACVYTSTTDIVNYPTGTTPVAYIPFDNSSEDLVSGDFGTLGSGTEFRFGRFGQAMVGNQNTWSADFPNISETANSPFSVSCWVNIADRNSTIYFFLWSSGFGSSSAWGGLLSGQSGKYYTNFGNQVLVSSSSVVPPLNQWFHYVLTYDGTNVKVYSDTEKVIDGNINTSALASNNLKVLYNGSSSEAKIDQMRIYDAALTSDQVTELYNEKPEVDTSNFKAVLYEGTSAEQYISNVGFQPDFIWIKNRDDSEGHGLFDSVRGANLWLRSNAPDAETDFSGNFGVLSFEENGFFIGNGSAVNGNNESIVAWAWKSSGDAVAGTGTGVSNVSISANTEAGFSIVKYTGGNGASDTVNHGLTDAEMIILKDLDDGTNQWRAWHKDLNANHWMYLNLSNAQTSAATDGGIRNVDANTFGFINGTTGGVEAVNSSASDYIAYVWKSVAGYSKIGSYTGATSGVTENIGFEPSMVIIKNATQSDPWGIFDNKRPSGTGNRSYLYPNTSDDEDVYSGSLSGLTLTSTGFAIDNTNSHMVNQNGETYIYMAFK